MRQPDINTLNKAEEHVKDATLALRNIEWENPKGVECEMVFHALASLAEAQQFLAWLRNYQDTFYNTK